MWPPVTRVDDLYWLRSDDRDDPAVLAHLKEENGYATVMAADQEGLREELFAELKGRLQETDAEVPAIDGAWAYFRRTVAGEAYPRHCRAPAATTNTKAAVGVAALPGEQVMLDENVIAGGGAMCDVGAVTVSPDGGTLAFTVDTSGAEVYDVRFKDAAAPTSVPAHADVVTGTSGDVEWGGDDTVVYYTTLDDTHRPHKVWRHVRGTPQADDVCLFTEDDERFWTSLSVPASRDFLFIDTASKLTSEVRAVPLTPGAAAAAGVPIGTPTLLEPRLHGRLYEVSHHRGADGAHTFVILTNADGAKNFQVCVAPVASPGAAHWRVVLADSPTVYLQSVMVRAKWWAIAGRADGYENVWVAPPAALAAILAPGAPPATTAALLRVPPRHAVYAVNPARGNLAYDAPSLRFTYTSPVTPDMLNEVAVVDAPGAPPAGDIVTLKQKVVPNFDAPLYATAVTYAPAPDGTAIPVSILYRPDAIPGCVPPSGIAASAPAVAAPFPAPVPALLYGYGSYGASMDMYFDASRLSFVDRGMVYAVAHVRGGSEMGRGWYEDGGRLLTKRNTFTDFIAVAEHLVATGWTARGAIAAQGASAGGLLMGVVVNERPDLWGAILSQVGFVDVLTTMADDTIPLTVTEWEEWGNPHEAAAHHYIASYSPMDNVRPQAYPPMLLTAGLHDSRVAYWEPAKFAQRLRAANTGPAPILLKTELVGGHFSFMDRYAYLRDKAWNYAWVLTTLGVV